MIVGAFPFFNVQLRQTNNHPTLRRDDDIPLYKPQYREPSRNPRLCIHFDLHSHDILQQTTQQTTLLFAIQHERQSAPYLLRPTFRDIPSVNIRFRDLRASVEHPKGSRRMGEGRHVGVVDEAFDDKREIKLEGEYREVNFRGYSDDLHGRDCYRWVTAFEHCKSED